jgi:hypothetical protein
MAGRFAQIIHMPDVQDIEDPIGESDAQSVIAPAPHLAQHLLQGMMLS